MFTPPGTAWFLIPGDPAATPQQEAMFTISDSKLPMEPYSEN